MPAGASCPDPDELRRLIAQGGLPDEVDQLARHLESCPACGETVEILLGANDTFPGLDQAPSLPVPQDAIVEDMKDKLRQLQPAVAAAHHLGITPSYTGRESSAPGVGATDPFAHVFAPPQQPDEMGRLGQYRILKKLGAGGMGAVWLAEDVLLQRKVALKTMLPALAALPSARERFLREARTAASIEHENVVAIHQVAAEPVPHLAMPLLRGESLETRLEHTGRLPIGEAVRIATEMARGLEAAHALGLIHRDIKPANVFLEQRSENVGVRSEEAENKRDVSPTATDPHLLTPHSSLLTPSCRVKILDFGLARSRVDDARITQSGMIVGTPAFMAPEQAQGETVDARADLFSLGAVLYLMLTGTRPFKGNNAAAVLTSLVLEKPRAARELNSAVPPELDRLVMRLLAKQPEERPASAREVSAALAKLKLAPTHAAQSRSRHPETAMSPPVRRRRAVLLTALLAGAAVIAAAIVFYLSTGEGTLRVEISDPDITVAIKGTTVTLKQKDADRDIVVRAGAKSLIVTRGEFFFETDKLVLRKNEIVQVKVELLDGHVQVLRDGVRLDRMKLPDAAVAQKKDHAKETKLPSASPIPPPTVVPEPPPLADWLKGRTSITVSQDGKGQYKTIQAALTALRKGQVARVLDRGPYRERLELTDPPEDVGLVSDVQTIIEVANWKPRSGGDPAILHGHQLENVNGFRVSGFAFMYEDTPGGRSALSWTRSANVVVEDCAFIRKASRPQGPSGLRTFGYVNDERQSIVVRDCYFAESELHLAAYSNGPPGSVLIERNFFHRGEASIFLAHSHRRAILRHNIIDATGWGFYISNHKQAPESLQIYNNTVLRSDGIQFATAAPPSDVAIRNNILSEAFRLTNGAEKTLPAAVARERWQMSNNCYKVPPETSRQFLAPQVPVFRRPGDLSVAPEMLSENPGNPHYARVSADGPLATGGAGGAWPSYVGALPPGPAPREGDWFTRLRARWGNLIGMAPARTIPPPSVAPESPPLTDWLKGREVLTVSQDGKGQYKTIQAALLALKKGQVVKVLDHGPYRESLVLADPPEDVGLISDAQTVIEVANWVNVPAASPHLYAHRVIGAKRFRLSGFKFVYHDNPNGEATIIVQRPDGLVVEDCAFVRTPGPSDATPISSTIAFFVYASADGVPGPVVVRDCLFKACTLDVLALSPTDTPPAVLIERNYFQQDTIPIMLPGKHRHVIVRHNVLAGKPRPGNGIMFLLRPDARPESIEIYNNTVPDTGNQFNTFAPPTKVAIRNNLLQVPFHLSDGKAKRGGLPTDGPLKNWQLGNNSFRVPPESHPDKERMIWRRPDDLSAEPAFLSEDPDDANYLRISADSPLASGGTGGAWPSYVGALLPGPVPQGGDWFTRLRERWSETTPAKAAPVAALSSPTAIPEPPPLADWLKGRTVLTVSQDGKGKFKSIQAALDALKPGQVVKVLDRGPYREQLSVQAPADSGLVSESGAILELSGWKEYKHSSGEVSFYGHVIAGIDGFRVHGIHFKAELRTGNNTAVLDVPNPSGFIFEQCRLDAGCRMSVGGIKGGRDPRGDKPNVVRDCLFEGSCFLQGHPFRAATVLVIRNFFNSQNTEKDIFLRHLQAYTEAGRAFKSLVVQHNVFGEGGHCGMFMAAAEVGHLDIRNNTLLSPAGIMFNTFPRGPVAIRNNLHARPGIASLVNEAAKSTPVALATWQISHNGYPREGSKGTLPPAKTDVISIPRFLSMDPKATGFARLALDDPLGKAGAGGVWPTYIGAMPPGPAPSAGDWLTRLLDEWLAHEKR